MRLPALGIKGKLVTGFALFILLPIAALSALMLYTEKKDIMTATQTDMLSLIKQLEQHARDFSTNASDITQALSETPSLKKMAGELLKNPHNRRVQTEASQELAAFANCVDEIEALFLLHPKSGEVLASNDPWQQGKFFNKKPYFRPGNLTLELYRAHYSPAAGKSILAITVPVRNAHGVKGAILAAWVNLDVLRTALESHGSARTFLVNRSNLYLADAITARGLPILTGAFSKGAQLGLAGNTGTIIERDADGNEMLRAYTLIKPLDLALIVEKGTPRILAHMDKTARRVLMFSLSLAALVLGIFLVTGKRLADALKNMSSSADKITNGNFGRRLHCGSRDELGILCNSMNRMAESLETRDREYQKIITALEAVIENTSEGVALLSDKGKVILMNETAKFLLSDLCDKPRGQSGDKADCELKEISGKPLESYLVNDGAIKYHEISKDTAPGGGQSRRSFEVALRKINYAAEGGSGYLLSIVEVTEEKRARQHAHNQDKLSAVGQLTAGIAHDFNNILTSIIGFSEMLLMDSSLPEAATKDIELLNKSGLRAAELVGKLMDFSRKTTGGLQAIELRGAVAGFVRSINRIMQDNIIIEVKAGLGNYYVEADLEKLNQVLSNLTLNAQDSMPEGGRLTYSLSIETVNNSAQAPTPEMESGKWVRLRVADTGTGIPKEVLPNIFEPFFTTKSPGKGVGLGLAQAYGIIRQHGGHIIASSGKGGTSFDIYLPWTSHGPAALEGEGSGRGKSILLVEDDIITMKLMSTSLGRKGYNVITASDGAAGLETFKKSAIAIDLVITDMMMPLMNGYEMGIKMRQINPDIKLIAVSGYDTDTISRLYPDGLEAAGIVHWIEKPFEPSTIANAVASALNIQMD